jgi:uncharacterized protein (DUF433 family)
MRWQDYIEWKRDVMTGKPAFKSIRITLDRVLEPFANGSTHADLLESFPALRGNHVRAALADALESLPPGR